MKPEYKEQLLPGITCLKGLKFALADFSPCFCLACSGNKIDITEPLSSSTVGAQLS